MDHTAQSPVSIMLRRAQRPLSALVALVVLGVAVCSAVVAVITSQRGRTFPTRLESLDAAEQKKLENANVMAQVAVDSFPSPLSEGHWADRGFDNHEAFMRAHEGTQIKIHKFFDEEDKLDEPFKSDRAELEGKNEQNGHQMKAMLAMEDADDKRQMDATLQNWEDQRDSLQRKVDYQNMMNGVLNDEADRTGEMLVRQTKQTSKRAEAIVDQDRRQEEAQLKILSKQREDRESALAAQIVGLSDPNAPSEDEKSLLKQNIMSEQRLKEFE